MDEQQKRNHLGRQIRLDIDSIHGRIEGLIVLQDVFLGQWRVANSPAVELGLEILSKRIGRTLNEISELKGLLKKAEEYSDFEITFSPLHKLRPREEMQRERIAMGNRPERYVTEKYTNVFHRSIYSSMEEIIDLLEPLLAEWEIGNLVAVELGLRIAGGRLKRTRKDIDELAELKSLLRANDHSTTVSS